jgi:acyl-[acyl-carrier-protein]-phospholipid O-acyltransferase/long-chain-fatty-acid--[acyl-carrier-protein] ligase
MVNDLRKGYEIMARQGDAVVVPVYLDGLYGSFTSFEGGHFFSKWPRRLRYPVKAWYGRPLAAREATTEAVRRQILALGAEALLAKRELARETDPRRRVVLANALRLREVEWVRAGETIVTAASVDGLLVESLRQFATFKRRGVRVADQPPATGSWVLVATRVEDLATAPAGARLTLLWTHPQEVTVPPGVLRGLLDEATGELIAVSVPNPAMPEGEEGGQLGQREGGLGRLLPGIAYEPESDGVRLLGLASGRELKMAGVQLDEQGFLMPQAG